MRPNQNVAAVSVPQQNVNQTQQPHQQSSPQQQASQPQQSSSSTLSSGSSISSVDQEKVLLKSNYFCKIFIVQI